MSSDEETPKPFAVENAKNGRAACKKCKEKCDKGVLRMAKVIKSPFNAGFMKNWHHIDCIFEAFLKQRATTKRLENPSEIDGWSDLEDEDKQMIAEKFEESEKLIAKKYKTDYVPGKFQKTPPMKKVAKKKDDKIAIAPEAKDYLFKKFRTLIANITNVSSYTEKTNLVENWFKKGPDGNGFQGDLVMWCRLLLPGVVKKVYNLQSKQLIKLFSRIFDTDQDDMLEDLEKGDVSETIQDFFEKSDKFKPAAKSLLTVKEVDEFLDELSKLSKEDEQAGHFKKFAKRCTSNDLKVVVRLIKHDLRMNAGAKHILEGVHPDAYTSYQSSRDLKTVIERCLSGKSEKSITLLTPVLPMLAEPCKTITQAFKKCPNGIYSEIKYDGERVQVHKKGSEFRYYSRSLKPVMPHKIKHFEDFIPKAFPHGKDLILDSEILMVDTNTGKPLPFGTLGKHKREGLDDAAVCLFVFDCIYFNGEDLSGKPLKERKRILKDNMTEIENRIVLSELKEIYEPKILAKMITKVLKLGLEGLVLKDIESIYEPGKRHWLKVKKDYLFEGAMADSADLIVLGAWYGTGKKGGIMSVFLMGVYDQKRNKYCTVTKVHTGHDDKTLDKLQRQLDMVKISGDINKVPDWLKCTKTMVPDLVAKNPKKQPIWEVTGAEFTQQHDVHTANGISIRFPRVTKIRDDKDYKTATNLTELDALFKKSKDNFDGALFDKEIANMTVKLPKKRSNDDDGDKKKAKKNSSDDSDSDAKKRATKKRSKSFEDSDEDKKRAKDAKKKSKNNDSDDEPTTSKKTKIAPIDDSDDEVLSNKTNSDNDSEDDSNKKNSSKADDSGDIIKKESKSRKFSDDENESKKSKSDDNLNTRKKPPNSKKKQSDDEKSEVSLKRNDYENETRKRPKIVEIIDPLPEIFKEIKIYQSDSDFTELVRIFRSYAGTIVDGKDIEFATHILHKNDSIESIGSEYSKRSLHVTVDWLRDSILSKRVLHHGPYLVSVTT